MKVKKLTKYTSNQLIKYRRFFSQVRKGNNPEDIHQLRLSIKKLRSILMLMEIASNGHISKKPHLDLFNGVFRLAGDVRETQMNMQLVKDQRVKERRQCIGFYEKHLQHSMRKMKKAMKVADVDKLRKLDKKFIRRIASLKKDLIRRKSLQFLKNRYLLVGDLIGKDLRRRKLHKIRINLRMILEILTLLKKTDPDKELHQLRNEVKALNEQLGKWHDYQVLVRSLKHMQTGATGKKQKRRLAKLVRVSDRKERELRKSGLRSLKEHLIRHRHHKLVQFN